MTFIALCYEPPSSPGHAVLWPASTTTIRATAIALAVQRLGEETARSQQVDRCGYTVRLRKTSATGRVDPPSGCGSQGINSFGGGGVLFGSSMDKRRRSEPYFVRKGELTVVGAPKSSVALVRGDLRPPKRRRIMVMFVVGADTLWLGWVDLVTDGKNTC